MTDVVDARRIKRDSDFIHADGNTEQAPEETFGALARCVHFGLQCRMISAPSQPSLRGPCPSLQRSRIGSSGIFDNRCRWTIVKNTLTFRSSTDRQCEAVFSSLDGQTINHAWITARELRHQARLHIPILSVG